jgi:hypothetical protein
MRLRTPIAGALCVLATFAGGAQAMQVPADNQTTYLTPYAISISDNDTSVWDLAKTVFQNKDIRFDYQGTYLHQDFIDATEGMLVGAYTRDMIPLVTINLKTSDGSTPITKELYVAHARYIINELWHTGARHFEIGNEVNTQTFFGSTPDPAFMAYVWTWLGYYFDVDHGGMGNLVSGGLAPADVGVTGQMALPEYFAKAADTNVSGYSFLSFVDAVAMHPYTQAGSGDVSPDPNGASGSFVRDDARGWQWVFGTSSNSTTFKPANGYPSVREKLVAKGFGSKKIWATEFAIRSVHAGVTQAQQNQRSTEAFNLWKTYEDLGYTGPFFWFATRDKDCGPPATDDCGPGIFDASLNAKTVKDTVKNFAF